jgi:hypothetical protein
MNRGHKTLPIAIGALAVVGCGSRPSYWNTPVGQPSTYGLNSSVAVVDDANHRVLLIAAQPNQTVSTQSVTIGHNTLSAATTSDGSQLLVVSAGDSPRKTASDQVPSLTVVTGPTEMARTAHAQVYGMSEALPSLAIDPGGHWAVAYSSTPTAFVENPNELVIFDLTLPPNPATPSGVLDPSQPANPITHTIRSKGGAPQALTFTPLVQLPGGLQRHLLVVETNIDVSLLDLEDEFQAPTSPPPPSEITVELSDGTAGAPTVTPAAVAVYPGAGAGDLARVAIRASNDTNVYTLLLGPPAAGSTAEFLPSINLTDVGGLPSDVEFVHTDATTNGGLRVAALVPSQTDAVLIDPDTSLTTQVALPAAYTNLSIVTGAVSASNPAVDVALLWGAPAGAAAGVALWALGDTVGQPYFSVQGLDVSQPIRAVDVVPANSAIVDPLRVLEVQTGTGFFVLDLSLRTASPLTTTRNATLAIAPDGGRLWAFTQEGTDLAAIDLKTLNPIPLTTDLPIHAIYDIARTDDSTQRSLIAIHDVGTFGVTIFDALNPDPTSAREASALLLEAP